MTAITRTAVLLALLGLSGCIGVYSPPASSYGTAIAPPPAPIAEGYGATCFAGNYTCPLPSAQPAGTQCTCPGLGAPSYGVVR